MKLRDIAKQAMRNTVIALYNDDATEGEVEEFMAEHYDNDEASQEFLGQLIIASGGTFE